MDIIATNPKDSYIYSKDNSNLNPNPKGSNVYSNTTNEIPSTPTGSYGLYISLFYKYQIPSGLKTGGINK